MIEHILTRDTDQAPIRPPGKRVDAFSAATTGGALVTREMLTDSAGSVLVGFFSPDCDTCLERLPEFVRKAGQWQETIAANLGSQDALNTALPLAGP